MRTLDQICVTDAIVHVLSSETGKNIVLSEAAIPLAEHPEVAAYLEAHVQRSLRDVRAEAARFDSQGADTPFDLCGLMLAQAGHVVACSQSFALRLQKSMDRDKKISSGNLVVCRFTGYRNQAIEQFVAILKLDQSKVYRNRVEFDTNGSQYVTFDVSTDGLPGEAEKLQKCAFVQTLAPRSAIYDLLVLDRQAQSDRGDPVARFFLESVLSAQLAKDSQALTQDFNVQVVSFLSEARSNGLMTIEEEEHVKTSRDLALRGTEVDTTQWVASLPVPEPLKVALQTTLGRGLPQATIQIDSKAASRIIEKRKFTGSHGLRVEINAEDAGARIHVLDSNDDPTLPSRFRVFIDTDSWDGR